jgi:hypothetical protein
MDRFFLKSLCPAYLAPSTSLLAEALKFYEGKKSGGIFVGVDRGIGLAKGYGDLIIEFGD